MSLRTISGLAAALVVTAVAAGAEVCTIVPVPENVEFRAGVFKLSPDSKLVAVEPAQATARFLEERLGRSTGYKLEVVAARARPPAGSIVFLPADSGRPLPAESYTLTATPEKVTILAGDAAGWFYGVQSLLQLLPPQALSGKLCTGVEWTLPCVEIRDQPRFTWRGLLLDSSRHFWTVEETKRYLDLMAIHKLNVFHWHLVDHDGWRLEIKKYPKLTEVGAWRDGISHGLDPRSSTAYGPDGRYGGFYTQDEVREIVRYAAALHINVMPEIEMPGHFGAAVDSYPQFDCTTESGQPAPRIGACCAGNEEVFTFLEDVLTETMALFPNQYIHIGGDEVDKSNWKQCPRCQARIKAEKLKNEDELQSYFIRRMDKFLTSKGRTLVGWSEIRQGGLASNAVMMDWIGGGAESAAEGHDVVMSPTSFCYYDYYQGLDYTQQPLAIGGYVPLRQAYAFDPVPESLAADHQRHILGGQANLWTEFIASPRHLDFMTYPRACALAEVLWSPRAARNWDAFMQRLAAHEARLDVLGVYYCEDHSRQLGAWSPEQLTGSEPTLDWDATAMIGGGGKYHVVFDHTGGGALKIAWVALLQDGVEIARDTHAGVAGAVGARGVPGDPIGRDAVYVLSATRLKRGAKYTIRAQVQAPEGGSSRGLVTVDPVVKPVVR